MGTFANVLLGATIIGGAIVAGAIYKKRQEEIEDAKRQEELNSIHLDFSKTKEMIDGMAERQRDHIQELFNDIEQRRAKFYQSCIPDSEKTTESATETVQPNVVIDEPEDDDTLRTMEDIIARHTGLEDPNREKTSEAEYVRRINEACAKINGFGKGKL